MRKGEVVEIYDNEGGERIKVRLRPTDRGKTDNEIAYAFPLNPKMIHIKPKIGECVIVLCDDEDNPNSQRFYIGPVISQPQYMYKDEFLLGATALLKGGLKHPDDPLDGKPTANGALMKDDEIGIYGRKNSDIILSDDDIRIRCGCRVTNTYNTKDITFNKDCPSFIKLKFYPDPIILDDGNKIKSTATVVADKINLISPNGSPFIKTTDENESISDSEMKKIIEKAHCLPYGDVLADLLSSFLSMFLSHTHKYSQLPPCPDTNSEAFNRKYGWAKESIEDKLLSKNIRIN